MDSGQTEIAGVIRRTPAGAIDVLHYTAKGRSIRSAAYCAFIFTSVRLVCAGFRALGNGSRRRGRVLLLAASHAINE